jgi:hypothetical protein
MSTVRSAIIDEIQERRKALEKLQKLLTKLPDGVLALEAPTITVVAAEFRPLITLKYYDTTHAPPGLLSSLQAASLKPDESLRAKMINRGEWYFFPFVFEDFRLDVDIHPPRRKPCKKVRVTQILEICGNLDEDSYESIEVLEELDNDGS